MARAASEPSDNMLTRTRERTCTFDHPFKLSGVDRLLPPGSYRVVTDEELIEGLSFPVYRRVATMIFVRDLDSASREMLTVDPTDLRAALDRDAARNGERDIRRKTDAGYGRQVCGR
jgi:hypothetical protein